MSKIIVENHKQNYIKTVAMCCVVAMHYSPMNGYVTDHYLQLFCRFAVPFFFLTSGYWFRVERARKWLFSIISMYILWELIYLPIIGLKYMSIFQNDSMTLLELIAKIIFDFAFKGNYFHLWFFVGLMQSGMIVWGWSKTKFDYHWLIAASCVFYLIGSIYNNFIPAAYEFGGIGTVMKWYVETFESTYYSGIWNGLLFFSVGFYCHQWTSIQKMKTGGLAWLTLLSTILIPIEEYFSRIISPDTVSEMSLSIAMFSICLFFLTIVPEKENRNVHNRNTRFLRKLATLVYGIHCWVAFILQRTHIAKPSALFYGLVLGLSIVLATIVYRLSEYRKFRVLKRLY